MLKKVKNIGRIIPFKFEGGLSLFIMKKLLVILCTVILIAAIGGFWTYTTYFKPSLTIQQQLKTQFGPDFFNISADSSLSNTSAGENNPNSTISGIGNNSTTQNSAPGDSNQTTNQTPTTSPASNSQLGPNAVTENTIVQKYMPQIHSLQNTAQDRLDILYSTAVKEYNQDKKDGTLNKSQLAQKYIQAGNMLQGSVDSQFNKIVTQMQAELTANNLPTDQVNTVKSNYEQIKSSMRSQLLSKVL